MAQRIAQVALLIGALVAPLLTAADELTVTEGVQLVPTEWADGDSFRVRFPDGIEHTLRLYGADCVEYHVNDKTDARRLRAQRRYFGISRYGGSARSSMELAKTVGKAAADEVRALLSRPFTVHTAFADARGDGRHKRIYAFVTTAEKNDLATELVGRGLARAFGVFRASPTGLSKDDYRETLRDAELLAANKRRGVWAYTDWDSLAEERHAERTDEADTKVATKGERPTGKIDINTAARDELMRIPGVGEVTANAIIEGRPYRDVDDLVRLRGIGAKRLEIIRPWVTVAP